MHSSLFFVRSATSRADRSRRYVLQFHHLCTQLADGSGSCSGLLRGASFSRVQFRQLSRWFFGPARFLMYLRDPAVPPGLRSYALAASAAGITVEWLYCGVAVPVLLAGICWGDRGALPLTGVFLVVYTSQLVAVDCYLAPAAPLISRLLRLAAYPFVFMLFGLAGMSGLFQFLRGQSGSGKTERHI